MPNPVPLPKNVITMAVGGLASVAAFVVLAGTSGAFTPAAETTAPQPTTSPSPACPAGTVETATECVRTVQAPAAPAEGGDDAAPAPTTAKPVAPTRAPAPVAPAARPTHDEDADEDGRDDDTEGGEVSEPSEQPEPAATATPRHQDDDGGTEPSESPEPRESEPDDD